MQHTWTVKKQGWLDDIPFMEDVIAVVVEDDATKLGQQILDDLLCRHFDQDWGEICDEQARANLVTMDQAIRGVGNGSSIPPTVRGVYRTVAGVAFEVVTDIFLGRCDIRIMPA